MLVLKIIFSNLSKNDKLNIENQIESRLNDDGFFFIRLDKRLLIQNIFKLTEAGDCFHIKVKIAAYPASKERYVKNLHKLINSYIK